MSACPASISDFDAARERRLRRLRVSNAATPPRATARTRDAPTRASRLVGVGTRRRPRRRVATCRPRKLGAIPRTTRAQVSPSRLQRGGAARRRASWRLPYDGGRRRCCARASRSASACTLELELRSERRRRRCRTVVIQRRSPRFDDESRSRQPASRQLDHGSREPASLDPWASGRGRPRVVWVGRDSRASRIEQRRSAAAAAIRTRATSLTGPVVSDSSRRRPEPRAGPRRASFALESRLTTRVRAAAGSGSEPTAQIPRPCARANGARARGLRSTPRPTAVRPASGSRRLVADPPHSPAARTGERSRIRDHRRSVPRRLAHTRRREHALRCTDMPSRESGCGARSGTSRRPAALHDAAVRGRRSRSRRRPGIAPGAGYRTSRPPDRQTRDTNVTAFLDAGTADDARLAAARPGRKSTSSASSSRDSARAADARASRARAPSEPCRP